MQGDVEVTRKECLDATVEMKIAVKQETMMLRDELTKNLEELRTTQLNDLNAKTTAAKMNIEAAVNNAMMSMSN